MSLKVEWTCDFYWEHFLKSDVLHIYIVCVTGFFNLSSRFKFCFFHIIARIGVKFYNVSFTIRHIKYTLQDIFSSWFSMTLCSRSLVNIKACYALTIKIVIYEKAWFTMHYKLWSKFFLSVFVFSFLTRRIYSYHIIVNRSS